jgi:tRNA-dihydrouridine synthase B
MLKLGQLLLNAPFFQASLSGYSDYAMRRLAIDFGAPLTFAGVMLAKSAAHPKVIKKPEFQPHEDEHPVGAQLLGNEPEIMVKAAQAVTNIGYDVLDLNFACPAPKVLRRCRGGYMMQEPQKVIDIYRKVREVVSCPLLMKLRIGFDDTAQSRDNFWEIASQACRENIDALVVHGRTTLQKFRGQADWQILAELKRQFPKTTIIGSGDLFDAETIAERLKTAGLDGVAIARGAIGNPWIFRNLRAVLEGKPLPPPPSLTEQGEVILKHYELICQLYAIPKTTRYFRKFLVNYCKLHPERRKVQKALLAVRKQEELVPAIKQWYGLG